MKNQGYPYLEVQPLSSVPAMVKEKAGQYPDDIAFRYRKGRDNVESKTFREVYDDVRKVASWMSQHFGTGKHVAIIGENSYEWVLAFFSLLASGNVAVPIDKALPAREIAWMINKADAPAACVSPTYLDQTTEAEGLETLSFKKLTTLQGDGWEEYSFVMPAPGDLACIFFTSGTTGHSKGVMLSHGNIAYDVENALKLIDLKRGNSLSVLPFHHTFGLIPGVLAMYHQGAEIFLNRSIKQVKADLLLAKPKVMFLVPLFIEEFSSQIDDGVKKSGKEKKVKTGIRLGSFLLKLGIDVRRRLFKEILDVFGGELSIVVCGGARLDPSYQKIFRAYGIEVINGYGATECSPVISVQGLHCHKDGSVGVLLPGVEAKISPEHEVMVRGPIVMQGYYKDPEETEKALQDGWYNTGDLGYVDEDGFLFLDGRLKNLIILSNGENLSPEELENDFEADPAVKAVMVYEKDRSIVAAVYPREEFLGNQAYFDDLMNRVNKDRPAYKQVNQVVLRDEDFIRNTSQKIVRSKNIPQD